jgi:hypothetical protein
MKNTTATFTLLFLIGCADMQTVEIGFEVPTAESLHLPALNAAVLNRCSVVLTGNEGQASRTYAALPETIFVPQGWTGTVRVETSVEPADWALWTAENPCPENLTQWVQVTALAPLVLHPVSGRMLIADVTCSYRGRTIVIASSSVPYLVYSVKLPVGERVTFVIEFCINNEDWVNNGAAQS